MKYNFITREQVREAFTDRVKTEIEAVVKDLDRWCTRDDKVMAIDDIKKRLSPETLRFLSITAKQEKEHVDFLCHVVSKVDALKNRFLPHDWSKDDLFYLLVPAYFAGCNIEAAAKREIAYHHGSEPHHPEYEIYHSDYNCGEEDILEMALEPLARNAQMGDGVIRLDEVAKYMPTFQRENEKKQALFWTFAQKYRDLVQNAFDNTFMTKDPRMTYTIGKQHKRFQVSEWKGELRVDLWKWFPYDNQLHPSKQGVVLPLKRYAMLRCVMDKIDEAFEKIKNGDDTVDYKTHIGGNVHVTVKSPYACVNIRQWYKDCDEQMRPGRGVSLNDSEWADFKHVDYGLNRVVPEMNDVRTCMESEDHQNQLGFMLCAECNPNGLYMMEFD